MNAYTCNDVFTTIALPTFEDCLLHNVVPHDLHSALDMVNRRIDLLADALEDSDCHTAEIIDERKEKLMLVYNLLSSMNMTDE